jgi:hypothetical protein
MRGELEGVVIADHYPLKVGEALLVGDESFGLRTILACCIN